MAAYVTAERAAQAAQLRFLSSDEGPVRPPAEATGFDAVGVHRDTVRRLAAERTVPSEQEGPGCKLFFRRGDLDEWRCSDRRHIRIAAGGRS